MASLCGAWLSMAGHERLLISRYLWPGRAGRFILLVAAIGCAGVAIGVASLVLVVSFMNAADARLGGQIASADGHIFITGRRNALGTWSGLERKLSHTAGVADATSSVRATGLVTVAGRSLGADLQGIAPSSMANFPMFDRRSDALLGHSPVQARTIALGSDLASRLGVSPGDHAAITIPRLVGGDLEVRNFDFLVTGIITTQDYAFDSSRVVMPMDDLRNIVERDGSSTNITVWLTHPEQQHDWKAAIRGQLGPNFIVRSWRDMNTALFAAVAQERLAMTLVVALVTLIALSNIMCSMVMLVRHKAHEIAILRTIGMSRYSVAKVFFVVGAAIGLAGELAGLGVGLGLKAVKDPAVQVARAQLQHPPMELDVLLSLPLSISGAQLAWVIALVSTGIVLSTIYPALRAAAVDPALALRHT